MERKYRPTNIKDMFEEFVKSTKLSKQVLDSPENLGQGLYRMELFLAWMILFYEENFWMMARIALDRASVQEGAFSLQNEAEKIYKVELLALQTVCDELAGNAANILCTTIFIRSQYKIERFASDVNEPFVHNLFSEYQGFMLVSSKGYQFGSLINEESDCVKEYAQVVKRVINIIADMIPSLVVLERYFGKYVFFEGDNDIVIPTKRVLLHKYSAKLN